MNSDLSTRPFRGQPQPWSAGATVPVKLDFLAQARHMSAPEITEISFRFSGTVTPVGATALGRDFSKLIASVVFRDEAEMVNASGPMLRLLEQVELGSKQIDTPDMTVAGGAVVLPQAGSPGARLRLLFEPLDTRAVRPRDFRVPLVNFLEGGTLLFTMAAANPTGWGVAGGDWTITPYIRVVDGRIRELKSRRRILEQAVTQQEFDYQVQGSIRSAILGSFLTTTGYTSWGGFTTIYSRTLDLPPQFETDVLRDQYVFTADALGANDEFILAGAPGGIPLKVPVRAQKIGAMIDTATLHIDLRQAAPASARLLTDTVVNRTSNLAALSQGYGDPGSLAMAVEQYGVTVGAAGNMRTTAVPKPLARKLPIRLKPGGKMA